MPSILRDILARSTDFDYGDASWTNWGDLDTARSGWTCNWWTLKPVGIDKLLNQLQFEGCFIFKMKNTADGANLIWIKDSYSSADFTFNENDYSNLEIGLTNVGEVETTTNYNFQKHPAKNIYLQSSEYANSTDRTNWLTGTNENKKEKKLDFITADKVYTPIADTDPNDCIALYYDNILSEPKIIVRAEFSSLKAAGVEAGDIIQFNDSLETPFGKTWSDLYFIVTDVKRIPNKIILKAREVYETP